ncbi:MAG: archaellin/type IV pilin N-terminal domain-containing protein [Candidatus Methanomethylicia archaeon]
MRRLNRRGISPVIATIIIVAVAIAIAIAVAFWVVGIAGLFTRYEKLEISYIYAKKDGNNWVINLLVKNTGSATATIDQIFLNGKPPTTGVTVSPSTQVLDPGSSQGFTITIPITTTGFSAGTTVEVKLHTAAGQEYYKAVVLP